MSHNPVDYNSLILCASTFVSCSLLNISSHFLLPLLAYGTAITGFLYNAAKFVLFIKTNFFNKKQKNEKDDHSEGA